MNDQVSNNQAEDWTPEIAGLVERCTTCEKAKAAWAAFQAAKGATELKGDISYWDGSLDEWANKRGTIHHGAWVQCPDCQNTGLRLTTKGTRLLDWLAAQLHRRIPALKDPRADGDDE